MSITKTIIGAFLLTDSVLLYTDFFINVPRFVGKTNLFFNHTVVKRKQNIFILNSR